MNSFYQSGLGDNRRRSSDTGTVSSSEQFIDDRRLRPEDLMPFVTRFIINKKDLPRIIGLGGQLLSAIIEKTGAHISLEDIPDSNEEVMLVLGGYLRQVIDSFDLVTERLFIPQTAYISSPLCTVCMLIEDVKAGKVVGPRAGTIQAIKTKSGATQIRMLKPTLTLDSLLYRSLIIEGNLLTISRAHFLIHELFAEAPPAKPISNVITVTANTLDQSIQYLAQKNVPYEAALKYQELYHYIKQYGLCLVVAPIPPPSLDVPNNIFAPDSESAERGVERRCEFPIPKENAGFVIGKGGETLKALEEEFKLHIHVEKIPTGDNKRMVVVIGENIETIYRAREKILQMAGGIVT